VSREKNVSLACARNAMATRFEIVLNGDDPARLRAAAEETFSEIERLEAQLSLFRPTSEIANVNSRAAHEPVRVSPETFRLLQHAARLSEETGGAFDITIAPLMRAWGFMNGSGHLPDPDQLAAARACVGMNLVRLDTGTHTVRFARPGVMLDLGAIGKGYAVGRAAELLRDLGITSALIHGGTSTACAIGRPPDADSWRIAVKYPHASTELSAPLLAEIELRDEALSMSAGWGKSFQANGRHYGHVLDPRTGEPANNALLAVVATKCATETDALSTALLTLGPAGMNLIGASRPGLRAMVVADGSESDRYWIEAKGVAVLPRPCAVGCAISSPCQDGA
jgi:thiamine biosynthesis lipoprotein